MESQIECKRESERSTDLLQHSPWHHCTRVQPNPRTAPRLTDSLTRGSEFPTRPFLNAVKIWTNRASLQRTRGFESPDKRRSRKRA
jgi:hypothetical protein